jgi:hypothetical protein
MEIVDPELFGIKPSQPIDKVKYFSLHDDQSVSFTDVKNITCMDQWRCTPNCIDFDAEYSKAGYKLFN